MSQLAINYGANARPAYGGEGTASTMTPSGARLVPGAVGPCTTCSELKNDGTPCGARPANDTEMCAGHLRKNGRL